MALNPNHTFEDLGDVKCAIVEKNCTQQRVDFLKHLLEFNKFEVVVVKSPPPKVAAKPAAVAEGETPAEAPPVPETFTVGVTDVTFSPTNAVFNRELKTPDGEVVTTAYWKQLGEVAKEDFWYWRK
jgi:hypothetical protein